MEDLTSQVMHLNTNGLLKIDSAPLEELLLGITQALKNHDVVVSKLPEIEAVHSGLRRDLNKLKIALEAAASHETDDDANTLTETSDYSAADKAPDSYGLRKCNIEPIQRKRVEQSDKANDVAITNGLRDVKAKVRQLQQDRDESLANSLELDGNIKALKDDLLNVQQKLTASVTIAQLQMLQQSMASKHSQMEAHLNSFQAKFRDEVRDEVQQYLADVKSSFTSLEEFLKQRQDKMDARVSSCAKEYDVAAFRENVETEIASLGRKTAFLDDTAKAQGKTLVMLMHKNALALMHRRYSEWKRNALQLGMTRWKDAIQRQIKYEDDKLSQKRLMKKILTNIMSRRKRVGWMKWVGFRDWQRKIERMKVKASALVYERLKYYLTSSTRDAFNKWRRMMVADKMKYIQDEGKGDDADFGGDEAEKVLSSENSSVEVMIQLSQPVEIRRKSQYNLDAILDSMKNDAYGAACAVSQELENIKVQDIATLRKDLITSNKALMTSTTTIINEAVQKIDAAASEFQLSISNRVDGCDSQFPSIHSQLKELSNLFKSHKALLKDIEESNRDRLETLFDQNDGLEKRLSAVEELSNQTSVQVASMIKDQSKANETIQQLSQVIASNEAHRENESNALREVMDRFGDELLRVKVTLGHTQVRCETLETELASTKQELSYFQEVSQAESEKVADAMNRPGIEQTNMDRIVKVGHAYENLAKEKNYVTGINVMATMTSVSGHSTKSNGEKRRREEQIDVPAEIAAFAHDYAEWIAYQADHESLLRLIAGTNPDEQVYAEDDVLARRKSLLEELKSNLSTKLEQVAYPGVIDLPDSSTRGLGLRWEARAIFLARVLDATKAALSKHDHLSLATQTRLGRTRPSTANVTVCVACDRPMRSAHSDGLKQEGETAAKKGNKADTKEQVSTKRLTSADGVRFEMGELLTSQTDVLQRSSSMGRIVRGTHLAESLKGNSSNRSNDHFA